MEETKQGEVVRQDDRRDYGNNHERDNAANSGRVLRPRRKRISTSDSSNEGSNAGGYEKVNYNTQSEGYGDRRSSYGDRGGSSYGNRSGSSYGDRGGSSYGNRSGSSYGDRGGSSYG
ncbi:MAG: hypothetical protein WCS67_03220, partial [Bacteroidales bacterium]